MSIVFDGKGEIKAHKHLVFIGHLDHGKSSIVGRLFYDTGNVGADMMERINTMAKEMGREGFEYAFIMDSIKEERMRGITIGLAHKKLLVDDISFTFADAPGHKDFVKNMLIGASESDSAVLVIDANDGIQSQTRQHIYLSKMLGVPSLVVALNKMDLIDYSEEKFNERKNEITELIKKVGYDPSEVPIIPCSATEGQNISSKPDKMAWYDGPTVLEIMKNLPDKKVPSNLPLRLPVQDIYVLEGTPVVIARLSSGTIGVGDKVKVWPQDKEYEVEKMFIRENEVQEAVPDDNVYLYLKGLKEGEIKRADMIAKEDQPTITQKFNAQIMVIGSAERITEGHDSLFEMLTEDATTKVVKLLKKVDTRTGETFDNPPEIKEGESVIATFESDKPLYIEAQSKLPHLSNFRLKKGGKNIAMGICTEVLQ